MGVYRYLLTKKTSDDLGHKLELINIRGLVFSLKRPNKLSVKGLPTSAQSVVMYNLIASVDFQIQLDTVADLVVRQREHVLERALSLSLE